MRWSPGRHLGPRPRSRDRLRALLRPPERQRDRYHRHRHCARRRRTHRGALGRAGPLRRARADRRPGQALVTSPTAAGRADVPDVATGSASTNGVQLAERLVRDQFRIIETGELELATSNVTAGYVNHRSVHEPLAARAGGPAALVATATWLRRAFSDIRFEIHEIAVIHDRAIAWVTLHATDTGPFVVHDSPDGAVTQVFPRPDAGSPAGRCTGSASRTAPSRNTTRSATTWGWLSRWDGSPPAPPSCSAWCWRGAESVAPGSGPGLSADRLRVGGPGRGLP